MPLPLLALVLALGLPVLQGAQVSAAADLRDDLGARYGFRQDTGTGTWWGRCPGCECLKASVGLTGFTCPDCGLHLSFEEADALASNGTRATSSTSPPAEKSVPPLFDVEKARFRRFSGSEPPPREWFYRDLLPKPLAGQLIATGGTGKSVTLYQLAMSAAAGVPFLGFEPGGDPCTVLLIGTEDDEDELHRRGRTILEHYRNSPGWTSQHTRLVEENLYVVSRIGEDNLLTRPGGDGEVHRTEVADRLVETANRIPGLGLLIVEPISRLRGGKTNDPDHGTRFVETCEYIRRETGTTLLAAGHVNKTGVREGGGVEMSMGAITVTDSFRWNATMEQLRADQAAKYGLAPEDARFHVLLNIPKANYMAPFEPMWLRREHGGVLVPAELERKASAKDRTEAKYLEVIAAIQSLIRNEGPMSRNRIESDYAGELGPLGVGQKKVRDVINRAIPCGDLVERDNPGRGGGKVLEVPGGGAQ